MRKRCVIINKRNYLSFVYCLLLSTTRAICLLYHVEKKLHFNDGDVRFVLDKNTELDFYTVNSLTQQS